MSTTDGTPLMLRLLSACVTAAERAGCIIREVTRAGQLGVIDKGGNDPQTEADRKAQRCIVASLAKKFPEISVQGEETLEPSDEDQKLVEMSDSEEVLKETCPAEYDNLQEKDVLVWVDPLDGTKDYVEGFLEHVTVLVGISIAGKAVGGVIHQPYTHPTDTVGRTVWGLKGMGARGITVSSGPLKKGQGLHVAASRPQYNVHLDKITKPLNPVHCLINGGCGHKMLLVLEGKVDTYIFPSKGSFKWDTCAGDGIIAAMGGVLTDIHGRDIDYTYVPDRYENEMGFLVTLNRELHHSIVSKVPGDVKDAFPYA